MVVKALCDRVRFFAVEGVIEGSHAQEKREKVMEGKVRELECEQDNLMNEKGRHTET